MARTAVTVELMPTAGGAATYTAANADGHKAVWSKDLFLHVKAPQNRAITILTPGMVDGLAIADRVATPVPVGGELFIPLGRSAYVQADGYVYWDYDAVTSTTVAVQRLGVG
jgi:hypothetical protein